MDYDVIIRNGTIIDGSGMPRFAPTWASPRAISRRSEKSASSAREVIDAEGHVVTPGFIDVHTHMDAQVFWDPIGTCSCWHGITTVAMGNCGFSLAPCAEKDKLTVIRNLERAEDISPEAMEAGMKWSWETFPQYLDAVERTPKGINYAPYVGHSALRTYVMGERGFTDEATPADLEGMKQELRTAMQAGAPGLTTSRTVNHQTPDGSPVASRLATWDEVRQLVGVMGELNAGTFEIAGEDTGRDPRRIKDTWAGSRPWPWIAASTSASEWAPAARAPEVWRNYFDMTNEAALEGGRMSIQVHSRWIANVQSFETTTLFDRNPVWRDIRKLPLEEQEAALRDPEMRRKLVAAAYQDPDGPRAVGAEPRRAEFDWFFLMDRTTPPYRSIAQIAAEQNKDPVEMIIDLALEKHLKCFFLQPLVNENQETVLEMMQHPRSVVTFSDSGAHVSQIMDSSLQTHLMAYWVRERQALTLEQAMRMLTFIPASHWGFTGRGMLREGMFADVIVFNPDTVMPQMPQITYDLPAGARRLKQKSSGHAATVVNGEVLLRNNEHTGALPGKLLRNRLVN